MDFKSMKLESRTLIKQILAYLIFITILVVGGLIYLYFCRDLPLLEGGGRTGPYGLYLVKILAEGQLRGSIELRKTGGIEYCINFKRSIDRKEEG